MVFKKRQHPARTRWMAAALGLGMMVSGAPASLADVPALSVVGGQVQANGKAAELSGMSLFWSNTGWGGERYYNAGAVKAVKTFFGGNLVRVAVGVDESGGYLSDREGNLARARAAIDAAIANDLYVIIDWHSHYAHEHEAEAIAFFKDMATRYGKKNHVIYEIFNEPKNDVSWAQHVKPYAQRVVAAIRAIDPDNLIVVGNPTWSQDVDVAAADPIRGVTNLAYTLHFYAGTHGEGLRDKARKAMNLGAALFVTEWGTVNADGNGGVAQAETDRWVQFMKQYHLGNANWALNDKSEGASALKPNTRTDGQWGTEVLTASGLYVRDMIRSWTSVGSGGGSGGGTGGGASGYPNAVNLPGRVEAEQYTAATDKTAGNANTAAVTQCTYYGLGVDVQNASGGTCNVGWTQAGEQLRYRIGTAGGRYDLNVRLASLYNGQRARIAINGQEVGVVSTSGGGWQAWTTETLRNVDVPAGATITVDFLDSGVNLDYLNFATVNNGGTPTNPPGSGGGSTTATCRIGSVDQWNGGFVVNDIEVTNSGSTALKWRVAVEFDQAVKLTQNWSSNLVSTETSRFVFDGLSWNGQLQSGQKANFGFQGTHTGSLGQPRCKVL